MYSGIKQKRRSTKEGRDAMVMLKSEGLEAQLSQFTGTQYYYKHLGLKLTDGVKFLCEQAGAYWLLDAIASHQPEVMKDPMLAGIQFWTLKVNLDKSAVLVCERDTDDPVITQKIEYTDFPLERIQLYVQQGVVMLPSEY